MPVNQCLAHYSTDLQCVKFNPYFSTFVIICVCTRSTNNLFTAGCHILCSSFEIPFEDADPNSLKPLFSWKWFPEKTTDTYLTKTINQAILKKANYLSNKKITHQQKENLVNFLQKLLTYSTYILYTLY